MKTLWMWMLLFGAAASLLLSHPAAAAEGRKYDKRGERIIDSFLVRDAGVPKVDYELERRSDDTQRIEGDAFSYGSKARYNPLLSSFKSGGSLRAAARLEDQFNVDNARALSTTRKSDEVPMVEVDLARGILPSADRLHQHGYLSQQDSSYGFAAPSQFLKTSQEYPADYAHFEFLSTNPSTIRDGHEELTYSVGSPMSPAQHQSLYGFATPVQDDAHSPKISPTRPDGPIRLDHFVSEKIQRGQNGTPEPLKHYSFTKGSPDLEHHPFPTSTSSTSKSSRSPKIVAATGRPSRGMKPHSKNNGELPNAFCSRRDDGFYRHPGNCSRILQCFGKSVFEYPSCSYHLAFDEGKQACNYRDRVQGCNGTDVEASSNQRQFFPINNKKNSTGADTIMGCKGRLHGDHLANPGDCTTFYRCVWDRLVKMSCPTGTVFNPRLSVCDYPQQVPGCENEAAK